MHFLEQNKVNPFRVACENLSFAYGKRFILRNLSFQVESKEILHVVGSNGTGKSTLLALLAGLKKPTTGEVKISSLTSSASSTEDLQNDRHHYEYLPAEGNALYQTLDSQENLRFWLGLRSLPSKALDQQITKALQIWGLDWQMSHLRLPVSKFSTGMRRRLALARLMLSPASIWLLDEPLYGLDHKGCRIFLELLTAHRERGGITILVTHETSQLESLLSNKLEL